MNRIDREISLALKLAETNTENYGKYCNIYPWTNEELGGVFNNLCKPNSKVLTVCSSGDHILNAILYDCTDITTFDINKFTFYYLDLKLAAIESFSRKKFLKFMPGLFSEKEYIANIYRREKDGNIYSIEELEEIKNLLKGYTIYLQEYRRDLFSSKILLENLKNISKESYEFWTKLYSKNKDITDSYLFKTHSCGTKNTIIYCANYLKSNNDYQKVKNNLSKVNIKRHWTNIKTLPKKIKKEQFGFIHFSNIASVAGQIFTSSPSSFDEGLIRYSNFLKKEIYPLLNGDGTIIVNRVADIDFDIASQFQDYTMKYAFRKTDNPLDILDLPQGDRVYYKKI